MKRTFITFSEGESNNNLMERLRKSITQFSNYDLKVYNRNDFDLDYDTSDPEFWKSGLGYIYKVLSCIKALEEYDEVVWIDTDCLATNYIDKIWFENWRLDKFPLLPKYRFSMFGQNTAKFERVMNVSDPNFLKSGKEKVGCHRFDRDFYSQACLMFFNKSCLGFFEEALSYFTNYNKDFFPLGDESIMNCLFWKYNYTDSLGEIFLCSQFMSTGLTTFIQNNNRENFKNTLSIIPIENKFENILFLHGSKSIDVVDKLLNCLINNRGLVKSKETYDFKISFSESDNKIYITGDREIKCDVFILKMDGSVIYKTETNFNTGVNHWYMPNENIYNLGEVKILIRDIDGNLVKEEDIFLRDLKYKTPLCEIMKVNGSDKSTCHNYTEVYYELFKDIKNESINLFEVGIGTNNIQLASNMGKDGKPGASLRGWREFFTQAKIYGGDIDKDILFEEDRIKTFFCDQLSPDIIKSMWSLPELKEEFDIIIDDGLHEYDANITFFENSIHKLKSGGYFIIEDLLKNTLDLFKSNLSNLESSYKDYKFTILELNHIHNLGNDNNLLIIRKI